VKIVRVSVLKLDVCMYVLLVLLSVHLCSTLTQVNLTATCNANCHCLSDVFEPVCGADNVVYFSPCYAGCLNTTLDRKVELDSVKTVLVSLHLSASLMTLCFR